MHSPSSVSLKIATVLFSLFSLIANAQIINYPLSTAEGSIILVPQPLVVDSGAPTMLGVSKATEWRKRWSEVPTWGGRIGYLDDHGNLYVSVALPGNARSDWVLVSDNVTDFQLMDWRISILKRDGKLLFAEGPLNVGLREIASDVLTFQMSLTRLGYTQANGHLFVKEHGFLPRHIYDKVKSYQIDIDKIGVLTTDNNLYMSRGGGHINILTRIEKGVEAFQFEREWVGIRQEKMLKLAKWDTGKLDFSTVQNAVEDFELEATVNLADNGTSSLHVVVVDSSGGVSIGESTQSAMTLHAISSGAKRASWSGRQLITTNIDGTINSLMLLEDASHGVARTLGKPSAYSVNQEGTVVFHHGASMLSVIRTEAGRSLTPPSSYLSRTDIVSELALRADWIEENIRSALPSSSVKKLSVSSIRPEYTRRAIEVH